MMMMVMTMMMMMTARVTMQMMMMIVRRLQTRRSDAMAMRDERASGAETWCYVEGTKEAVAVMVVLLHRQENRRCG